VVQEVLGVAFPTGSGLRAIATGVDRDVYVPATLLAVRGDFEGGRELSIRARVGQARLLVLGEQGVPAVALRDGGDGRFGRVVLRRRARQQVAASALLVARVVGEEVLEQPRRCLACTGPWLAGPVNRTRRHCTRRHGRQEYVWGRLRSRAACLEPQRGTGECWGHGRRVQSGAAGTSNARAAEDVYVYTEHGRQQSSREGALATHAATPSRQGAHLFSQQRANGCVCFCVCVCVAPSRHPDCLSSELEGFVLLSRDALRPMMQVACLGLSALRPPRVLDPTSPPSRQPPARH
jgi:hypothetical protein